MKVNVSENLDKQSIELKIEGKNIDTRIFDCLQMFGYIFNKKSKIWFKPLAKPSDYTSIVLFFRHKTWDHQNLAGIEVLTHKKALEQFGDTGLGKINEASTYEVVNRMLLAKLNSGEDLFWRKGWRAQGYQFPKNYKTKHIYTGINRLILRTFGDSEQNQYLTEKQIIALGGQIKKGAKSLPVVYYVQWIHKEKIKGDQLAEFVKDGLVNDNGEYEEIRSSLKHYQVYAIENVEGIEFTKTNNPKPAHREQILTCEHVFNHFPKKSARLTLHNGDAYYIPASDRVFMPRISNFKKEQEYYATLFHEYIHSTGHKTRLNRVMSGGMNSKNYAFEELIAEIGASYLCAESGILYYTINNSAAYIKSWRASLIKLIKEDRNFFFKAAAESQKAVDYLLKEVPKFVLEDEKLSKSKLNGIKKTTDQESFQNDDDDVDLPKSLPKSNPKKISPSKLGALPDNFITIDQISKQKDTPPAGFVLPGEIGKFIGLIQKYRYAIAVEGEPFAGKSRLTYILADAFADVGEDVGIYSLEMGDKGHVIEEMRNLYIKPKNQKRIAITSEVKDGLQTIKDQAHFFGVIILDSWQKLNLTTSKRFDELRTEHPEKIFIVVFQQNAEGGTAGGSASAYDAVLHIKVFAPDGKTDFTNNYAFMYKNRLTGESGQKFNIYTKTIIVE